MRALAASGRYFNGQTAHAHKVLVTATAAYWRIAQEDGATLAEWKLDSIAATGPATPDGMVTLASAGSPARLVLPADALPGKLPRRTPALPWGWMAAVAGAVACAVAAWLFLPLPPVLDDAAGRAVAQAMTGPRATCAGDAGQQVLDGLTARLADAAGLERPVQVSVILTEEVNAFALPGQRILILRGLLREAEDGDELAGVLAHEIAHLRHRDPQQRLLETLGLQMAGRVLGSDAAGFAARLGALRHDRAAEARADAAAVALLQRAGLRADGLARFLATPAMQADDAEPGWMSDHPPGADRTAATAADASGAAALTAPEWKAVRGMCAITR